jgi:hypothetical protein
MAGMAVRRKEWQNSRMAEMATYVLLTVHTHTPTTTTKTTTSLIFYSIDPIDIVFIQIWAFVIIFSCITYIMSSKVIVSISSSLFH